MFFFFPFAEFGVHLAELTVDPQGALAIRQVSLPGTVERILMVVSLVFKIFFMFPGEKLEVAFHYCFTIFFYISVELSLSLSALFRCYKLTFFESSAFWT